MDLSEQREDGSVLVVCNGGGIGDALLATPVMRALRMRYRHVTALVHPSQASVIAVAAADEIWEDHYSFFELRGRIVQGNFDAAVVTWSTPRIAYALALAGVPVRVGQARRLYSPLFTHRVTVRSEIGDRQTHWTQILLDYARVLDCDGDGIPIAPLTPTAETSAEEILVRRALVPGEYIMLHPTRGITAFRESWPTSALARLATALQQHFSVPVLLSGSAGDREQVEAIAARTGAHSLAGAVDLPTFTALAARAKVVVAMDSGPMHLAAASGAPTVGIFAMRPDQPRRWAPLGRRTAVVTSTYPCPAWHTKERCPDFACVRALDVASVVAVVAGLIEQEREELDS